MTVVGDRVVVEENPLVAGGVDATIVSGKPPLLPTLKLSVAIVPSWTLPKLSEVGMMVNCAGGSAEPDTGTPKSPALVCSVATPPKTWSKFPDEPGAMKLTLKLIDALLASAPFTGVFVMVKGIEGGLKPVMLTELPDVLVKVTSWVTTGPPMGWAAKFIAAGTACNVDVELRPWPLSDSTDVPPVKFAVSVPGSDPRALGVNVTGTDTVWPAVRIAGNGTLGAPME